MRSAYPYSLGSVRADLVRRATFICASDCPQATALLPCPDAEVVPLLFRVVRDL